MANTVNIPIDNISWTEIAVENTEGLISNRSDTKILYREAASQPSAVDIIAHDLNPKNEFRFTMGAGQSTWAMSITANGNVAVTVD